MKKHIKRIAVVFMLLVAVFTVKPTTAYADVDLLVKDKTNKLALGDTMDECLKGIEVKLAAGKSISYKVNVPKGVLYLRIADKKDFIVEIYDSENKLVQKLESVTNELYGDVTLASDGVELSKGKYKIKIAPKDKKSELNLAGIVAMLKTNTSRTLSLDKQYNIAVKKGTTYKFKYTIKDANDKDYEYYTSFDNLIQSYDPNEFIPYIQEIKVLDSKGKTVIKSDGFSSDGMDVKNGTYTLVLKANTTGILTTKIEYVKNKKYLSIDEMMAP